MDLYNTENPHYMYTYVSDTVYCRLAHGPGPAAPAPATATATPAITGCGHCGRGRHRRRIEALQHANRPLIALVQVHRSSRRLGRYRSSSCSLCTQRYRRLPLLLLPHRP